MDQRAFEHGVSPEALMEQAAGHLARALLAEVARPRRANSSLSPRDTKLEFVQGRGYGLRVALLCGKGNNGGDGIAAARLLLDRGAAPTVVLVAGEDGLGALPAAQLARWRARGGRISTDVHRALAGADIVADCLLGTGTTGPPRPPYDDAIRACAASGLPVVACDLPSGVDASTGAVPGVAVRARRTVTLGAHKRGLWLWPARGHCGVLQLGDLPLLRSGRSVAGKSVGDVSATTAAERPVARVLEAADVAARVAVPAPDRHKRQRGVVVVLAGSPGMSGAATLVARGAMAAGAGLVTVATAPSVRRLVAPTVPEALTVDVPDDDPDAAFDVLAGRLDGADALAIGPGLGHAPATAQLVRRLVREVDVPVVLDADGLNCFRHAGQDLAQHAAPLLVLTPHAAELARLLAVDVEQLWPQRAQVVPARARDWRAVIVAKGPGSLVAAPDGRVWVNPTGSAALATGGTGDVLTGMTAALVAADADAGSVAAAVWLHGRAGERAATGRAMRAVTALDVAAAVPKAYADLDRLGA